ncbi:DUF3883 domain-containing protein [Piscinibacter sakaiensis]|uniref:DUF3883 domain-containing protein n=1 Tax=Piscinibacter sakaiensis TaxID=1547922 RepID=UPI003AAAC6E0
MTLSLADLTSAAAVQAALDQYALLGQEEFLRRHGFGRASKFLVLNPRTGEWADSKAIAGVAVGLQHVGSGGLKASDFSGGEATVVRCLINLGFEVQDIEQIQGRDWGEHEVALIVADYLQMLMAELAGQAYNKTLHRKRLMAVLPGRSAGSIEFKHCNISAALIELGYPYIKGYRPRANFQRSVLLQVVLEKLGEASMLDETALAAVERPAVVVELDDFRRVKTDAPRMEPAANEPSPAYLRPPVRRDYFAREAQNRSLGQAGEEFALRFERWRLIESGAGQLADRVNHASKTEGDGLGYDIRSFEADGSERFIEVKTTAFGDRTPFFVSANELAFSKQHAERFRLYRLFDFRAAPKLFELGGRIDRHCSLDEATYKASFSG